MAIVNSEIRFAPQLTAWFTANPTKVLQDGEIVYCSDGANVGKYVIGDNSTQLSALTFYGGISSSGLTIGTTTITSGTNTRILYNNAGVVGEYLVTGTGTTAVLSTSPTFTTSIFSPLVNGSSSVSGSLTLASTTNATKGTIQIGSTDLVNVGNAVTTGQRILRIGQDTARVDIGSLTTNTSLGAIYVSQVTPDGTNYALTGNNNGSTLLNSKTAVYISVNTNQVQLWNLYQTKWFGGVFSGSLSGEGAFMVTPGAAINLTANTEVNNFQIPSYTWTWNTGALATQKFNVIKSPTLAFNAASTATNVYGLYVEAATAGTNATITNNYAAGFDGNINLINASPTINCASGNLLINSVGGNVQLRSGSVTYATVSSAGITIRDGANFLFDTGSGTKIGTATSQKLSFWNATPIVQPTTAVAASTLTSNGGTTLTSTDTIDGYTLLQVVKALRNTGLLQ